MRVNSPLTAGAARVILINEISNEEVRYGLQIEGHLRQHEKDGCEDPEEDDEEIGGCVFS